MLFKVPIIKAKVELHLKIWNLMIHFSGTPCPKGMTSLMGECFGVVKNSVSNSADDSNCYWKSGDQNYELAVLRNVMQV